MVKVEIKASSFMLTIFFSRSDGLALFFQSGLDFSEEGRLMINALSLKEAGGWGSK